MRFKHYQKSGFESVDLSVPLDFFFFLIYLINLKMNFQPKWGLTCCKHSVWQKMCITKPPVFQQADNDPVRENTGSSFQRTLKATLDMSKWPQWFRGLCDLRVTLKNTLTSWNESFCASLQNKHLSWNKWENPAPWSCQAFFRSPMPWEGLDGWGHSWQEQWWQQGCTQAD